MNTFFVKDSVYTAVIMPTDEVEAAVLKAIAKNHQSEGVILTTQNTYILLILVISAWLNTITNYFIRQAMVQFMKSTSIQNKLGLLLMESNSQMESLTLKNRIVCMLSSWICTEF